MSIDRMRPGDASDHTTSSRGAADGQPTWPRLAEPDASSLVAEFAEASRAADYHLAAPAPLLCDDDTVPFTDATITPYKPALLRGDRVPPLAVVQPCLRLRASHPSTRAFTMLGLMAPGGQVARVARDGLAFLRDALPPGRVELVHAAGDADLAAEASPHADAALVAPPGTGVLSWRFGAGERLTGRGLAVCWSPPGPGPRVLVATLVLVTQTEARTEHVEIAADIEHLAALRHGVTPFEIEPLRPARQTLLTEGATALAANEIVDLVGAVAAAIGAGAQPGGHGRGHAVRQLIDDARKALAAQGLADSRLDGLLATVGASNEVRQVVASEVGARDARHR